MLFRLLLLSIFASSLCHADEFLDRFDSVMVNAYSSLAPSVVVVTIERDPRTIDGLPIEVARLLRSPETGGITVPDEQGSGVILDNDGYIVTNNHVIDNAIPGRISVRMADNREFPAKLIGVDKETDLALLKITAGGLTPAHFFDSSLVKVGQAVCAIGSPYKLPNTFTSGVVSAVGRTDITDAPHYEEYIQTDAAIHPGNSGGPLADVHGRVIGINTLINGLNRGLGFAVPSNLVLDIVGQLREHGIVERPWLGAEITSIRKGSPYALYYAPITDGAVVAGVTPGSPAANAGLRPGDVILSVGETPVKNARDIQKCLLTAPTDTPVVLKLARNHVDVDATVTLIAKSQETRLAGTLPPSPPPAANPAPTKLGLQFKDGKSLIVEAVTPGTMGGFSNIQSGDKILAIEGKKVESEEALLRVLDASDLSRGAMLLVERGGRTGFVIINNW